MSDYEIDKLTAMPKESDTASTHVSLAVDRYEWRENKTQYVKIDGVKLKEFYNEYLILI